ncbi:MAG: hypothetical protein LAP40_08320 [Acidobacteriia bacterium]|nr:hypothetical protein [Terriglobia bacterium]
MRCLFCGKDYFLPSQVKQDPDFCSLAHREKYNDLVERAMRRIQEAAPLPASEPMPAPAEAALRTSRPPDEIHGVSRRSGSLAPAAPGNAAAVVHRPESSAPVRSAGVATPAAQSEVPQAERASANSQNRLAPHPKPFRESPHYDNPRMTVRLVVDRLEADALNAQETTGAESGSAGMFRLLETPARDRRNARWIAIAAVAASLTVALALWMVPIVGGWLNHSGPPATADAAVAVPTPVAPAAPLPESGTLRHPLEWVRSAAAGRAATHLADSFDHGMAAWGVSSRDWVPGWSHSPDGYVRPGRLALFQPTLGYADYRMDFFGQIENKSLSWVVRGKDPRNYYVMKLNLVRPGLRPLLSIAHYPVVNGRPGHLVEVPLSIMIHNERPYHVSVEVKGSRYTVSIEGEEVDSWSDDTLPAGGVGFFAETGARARIYWIKVAKNDDWFGWLCARIAGSGDPRETAHLDSSVGAPSE